MTLLLIIINRHILHNKVLIIIKLKITHDKLIIQPKCAFSWSFWISEFGSRWVRGPNS